MVISRNDESSHHFQTGNSVDWYNILNKYNLALFFTQFKPGETLAPKSNLPLFMHKSMTTMANEATLVAR